MTQDPNDRNVGAFPPGHPFHGAKIVASYSRAQAIDDGVLADVSALAREAGFAHPVAITAGLHAALMPSERAKRKGQSYTGRLWDVLALGRLACAGSADDTARWKVLVSGRCLKVWARISAEGHNGAPVITIMLEGED